MVTYAYLRVSTNQQDVDNQRHGCLEYANQKSLGHLEFIEDSVSGHKRWRERELGQRPSGISLLWNSRHDLHG